MQAKCTLHARNVIWCRIASQQPKPNSEYPSGWGGGERKRPHVTTYAKGKKEEEDVCYGLTGDPVNWRPLLS